MAMWFSLRKVIKQVLLLTLIFDNVTAFFGNSDALSQFPVFRRGHAGIFLKNITEIMGIVIPCLISDPGGLFTGRTKEFFGLREPEINQILRERLPCALGKHSGKSAQTLFSLFV